jgi:hypothetical protein
MVLKLAVSTLVCLGRFACGIPECFVVRTIKKEFASYVIMNVESLAVSLWPALRNIFKP